MQTPNRNKKNLPPQLSKEDVDMDTDSKLINALIGICAKANQIGIIP